MRGSLLRWIMDDLCLWWNILLFLFLHLGCWRWNTFLRLWIILFFIFIHLGCHGGAWCRQGRSSPLIISFIHLFRLDIPNGHLLQSFINLLSTYIVIANNLLLGAIRFIKLHITCFFNYPGGLIEYSICFGV